MIATRKGRNEITVKGETRSKLFMKQITIFTFFILLLTSVASGQAKLSEKIEKRIADATPKSLPQFPIAAKRRSDAEDEALRGRVMTVVEERQYLSETSSNPGKHFNSITDFDETGNRVKAVYFSDNGNPYEVSVFGYVDGSRVSLFQTIYEDSGIFTGVDPSWKPPKERHSPDPRYSYKYEYRYVNNKLAGMEIFQNTGEGWMRYVYNRTGSRVEELVYDHEGKLNQKYVTVFDSKGYERQWYDMAVINLPQPDEKYLIRTESIDKRGNWTKRTFLESTVENGKEIYVPEKTEYRTITYYLLRTHAKRN